MEQALAVFRPTAYKTAIFKGSCSKTEVLEQPLYIPDFQSIMLPLMEIAADKNIHIFRDVINKLIEKYNLTDEEKNELLPSGKQSIFENRASWAKPI